MARAADTLVGRSTELAAVDSALAGLERGCFAALELAGEPGIGKTALLDELAARADAGGLLVLAGRAAELERDLPFWTFADALDDYVHGLDPRGLAELSEEERAELAHVLPSLPAPPAAQPPDHRFRTHRAVRRLLELLAATKPLVLVLDDVHWADSGSIELLGSLLRRPPVAPVLIALAVRPRQLPERLAATLGRALRSGLLTRVEVGALSGSEARELLGAGFGPATASALLEETGGNPFYLRQLAGRRPSPGAAAGPAGVTMAGVLVPDHVAVALTEELALLEPAARRVLEGAAVAGDPFELELAAAAADVAEPSAVDALDELLARDLVRSTEVPRRFGFRHPLVRGAVYEAAPGGWRLGAHERCAGVLAGRGAPAATRAHHVEHAARHGDAAAVAVLCEAAEAVAQRTPAGAARWYGGALRLLPADTPLEQRIGLLGARAGALVASGQFADAHAALTDAIRIAPEDAVALRVQLIAACAGVDLLLGNLAAADRRLERALEQLPGDGSPEAFVLMLDLARVAPYRCEFEAGRRWSERALDAARSLGDDGAIADAAAILALALAFTGDVAAGQERRAEAERLLAAMAEERLGDHLQALNNLAGAGMYLDRLREGLEHAERSVALARATGQGHLYPALVPILGTLLTLRGRLAEAAELEDGAIEAARLTGNEQALAWALYHRAFSALNAGEVELAVSLADECFELTPEPEASIVAQFGGMILGLALIERGDPAAGVELMIAQGGGAGLSRFPGCWRGYFLERLVRGELALGRRAEAEAAAAAAAAVAEATGLQFAATAARRAAAQLALDSDPATAAAHALASAEAADAIGTPVEAAVSRTLAGVALARAGDRTRGIAELQRAAAELEACGAIRHRDAAERELRRLGRRDMHRRTRAGRTDGTGVDALTERELQIARLIVDRKTNREIATELFLGRKTVETHIRNVFHKLDVSSRVAVARVVERADRELAARER